jgi:hypothetical protein
VNDASGAIAKMQNLKANIPKAMEAVGAYVLLSAARTITDGGNGWAPFKKLPKRPHQLLWDSGTLLRSLTPGDSDNVLTVSGDTITVGT